MSEEGGDLNVSGLRGQLPENLRDHEALTKFEKLPDLATAYVDLAGKSANSVQLPGEQATDEERATFFNRIGRPEAPDGYEFTRTDLPEGYFWGDRLPEDPKIREMALQSAKVIPYDPDGEKAFRDFAHAEGLTQAQANKVLEMHNQRVLTSWQEIEQHAKKNQEESDAALGKLWGDQKEGNTELAHRAFEWTLKQLGEEEAKDAMTFFKESGLHTNPRLIRMFHMIGTKLSEDNFVPGGEHKPGDKTLRDETGRPRLRFPSMGD